MEFWGFLIFTEVSGVHNLGHELLAFKTQVCSKDHCANTGVKILLYFVESSFLRWLKLQLYASCLVASVNIFVISEGYTTTLSSQLGRRPGNVNSWVAAIFWMNREACSMLANEQALWGIFFVLPCLQSWTPCLLTEAVLESFDGNGMEKQKHFLANLHAKEEKLHVRSEATLPMLWGWLIWSLSPKFIDLGHDH